MSFPSVVSLSNAEDLHRAFRGSIELTKRLRLAALITEIVAVSVAAWRTLEPDARWSADASFILALVVVAGVLLRMYSKTTSAFGERCRRMSIRAYSFGTDVQTAAARMTLADEPAGSDYF